MNKLIVISFSLLIELNGFGQDYLRYDKETITSTYKNLFENEFLNSSSFFSDTDESLKVTMGGISDEMEAFYFFDSIGQCDSIIINYLCAECSDYHMNSILSNKDRKWTKVEENYYITKKKFSVSVSTGCGTWYTCGTLNIRQGENIQLCFSLVDVDRKKWKELVK